MSPIKGTHAKLNFWLFCHNGGFEPVHFSQTNFHEVLVNESEARVKYRCTEIKNE